MQVQEIFLRAIEFYGDNGYFNLEDEEYKFLLNEIKNLNEKATLSKLEEMHIKGVFAILLYANKEGCIETLDIDNAITALILLGKPRKRKQELYQSVARKSKYVNHKILIYQHY